MKRISNKEMQNIIDLWVDNHKAAPYGLFYSFNGKLWVGCDNTTHNCWVEVFNTEEDVIRWLNDEYVLDTFGHPLNEWAIEE